MTKQLLAIGHQFFEAVDPLKSMPTEVNFPLKKEYTIPSDIGPAYLKIFIFQLKGLNSTRLVFC